MVLLRYSPYGYTPSIAWNATLFTLFAISFIVHLVQATRTRYWILFPTLALGALIELLGYAGRIWSSQSPRQLDPYLMQICLLILAPVFFSAYLYVVLGTAVNRLGAQYSIVPPKFVFFTFIIADIISLVLQAVGGGQAATSARTGLPTQKATDIMVAGIIFQLIVMGVFISCSLDFAVRVVKNKPYGFRLRRIQRDQEARGEVESAAAASGSGLQRDAEMADREGNKRLTPNLEGDHEPSHAHDAFASSTAAAVPNGEGSGKEQIAASSRLRNTGEPLSPTEYRKWALIMLGVLISSSMILTRGVFRSVELSEGWTGHLVTTEIYQAVLDGIPMVIAVGIFNVLHPGMILGRKPSWKGYY